MGIQQLTGSTEVTDVGHAGADEHFVDLIALLNNRLFVQLDGTARRRTLSGGIGQLERLLHFQIRQTFDFQNAAREDVFLPFLLNGQQALFNRIQRDRVNQVAQGDTRLHFTFEAHQH